MSGFRDGKKKKQAAMEQHAAISWQEKKDLADKEEEILEKEIEDLREWTDMIDSMNDEQLKEYLKNSPEELKSVTVKTHKCKPRQRVQQVRKTNKSSTSTGIMASVWKFHKEDEKNCSTSSDA